MGGGGGDQDTQSETLPLAENEPGFSRIPPELRPLATTAASQIQGLQGALPLSSFAGPQPAGAAGISPIQAATMQLLPALTRAPAGLNPLLRLGGPVGQTAFGAAGAGQPTSGAQAALRTLGQRLGGISPLPSISPILAALAAMLAPLQPAPVDNVFGLTPEQMMALQAAMTNQVVPVIGGPVPSVDVARGGATAIPGLPWVPPPPAPALAAAPAPAPAPASLPEEWIDVPARGGWARVRNR